MPIAEPSPKVIFFDAVGTLFHLPRGVGYHYALVGDRLGPGARRALVDRAFAAVWQAKCPRGRDRERRAPTTTKAGGATLVDRVLDRVAPQTQALDRDAFFEVAYAHFAEAGVWELYPETEEVLAQLQPRHELAVISNFDGRLRVILEQFGLSRLLSLGRHFERSGRG